MAASESVKGVITLDSKDKVKGIQDDQFFYTQDELQSIRLHKGMYLAEDQTAGALHLVKEIFNNANDEATNDNPHWNKVKKVIAIIFNQVERKITIRDNGRGIPLDILADVIMKKHASTKTIALSTIRNKKVTGLNGVGMTVCAALCDYMSVTSYRGAHYKTIELFDGEMKDHPIQPLKKAQTGTEVTLIPSEKYLGPINLTNDVIEEYVRQMSYILDSDIEVYLSMLKNPEEKDPKKWKWNDTTWKSQGLSAAVEYMSSSLEFPPITVKYTSNDFDLTLAFSYDKTLDDTAIMSFANFVYTTEGGTHETAAVRAISDYFSREGRRQDPKSKYEIVFDDCKRGLVLAVNLEHYEPKFEGQHKSKVSNQDVLKDGKSGLYQAIYQAMNNNPAMLRKVLGYLRTVAKARQEMHKIKGVSTKKNTTFLEDSEIPKYFTVSNRNSTGYKELFLSEGDSSAGAILNCRNPDYQALFTVQGVMNNTYGMSLTEIIKIPFFKNLIHILGTGIGSDFDITRCRYNKIIICTDSDVDGHFITSLLLLFFFYFMRPLLDAGMVYKAMVPLYLMDVKSLRRFYSGREWLYDKQEYHAMLNTIIANNCEVALEIPDISGKKKTAQPAVSQLTKSELIDWLDMNSEYRIELENLGKKCACEPYIVERICFGKILTKGDNLAFKKYIEETFPEMSYDPHTCCLAGAYDEKFATIICDRLFDRNAVRFMSELKKNSTWYLWYRNKKLASDKLTRASIGDFLFEMNRVFAIKTDQRFKGVGEPDPALLFKTVTNPKFRKLLRIDVKDAKETAKMFELWHGRTPALRDARRAVVGNIKISLSDIDN